MVSDDGKKIFFSKDNYHIEISSKYENGTGKLCVRPEMIQITNKNDKRSNIFPGKIINNIFEGSYVRYWIESLGSVIIVDQYNPGYREILDGDVFLYFNPGMLHVLQD
jgi:ABC-type Fe3+/spermidine/putrescine transport system ATPase subunit